MINIINDIPLIEEIYNYDVVLFAMGINNSMANGFSYDVGFNFPDVLKNEMSYQYGDLRKYGTIHTTKSDDIEFVACYIKTQSSKHNKSDVFVNYDYLDNCLEKIKEKYKNKKIACPLLGNNEFDGNGDYKTIMEIFNKYFGKAGNLTLYIYEQKNYKAELFKKVKQARYNFNHKLITKEDFFEICRILEWRKTHGIYTEVPDDFIFIPKGKSKRKIIHNKNGVIFKK